MLKRAIAATELLLLLPAAIFMAAIVLRNVTPLPNEPALTAQRIVMWYAHLPPQIGLWLLLSAMPFAVVVLGCSVLAVAWHSDQDLRAATHRAVAALSAHRAIACVAVATLCAGGILVFVGVHVLTD